MGRFLIRDHYFDQAKAEGFKARSVFKLREIDQRLRLIKPDSAVLDLGCAPGSWLQYLDKKLSDRGGALGIDLVPVKLSFTKNIIAVQDDCLSLSLEKLRTYMAELREGLDGFDVVLSDMAPKTTGIKHVDQARSLDLAHKALTVALGALKKGGHVVIKVFEGEGMKEFIDRMGRSFAKVRQMRPKGVRSQSKECYVVGMDKR